ncbi:hypothetical protein MMC30_004403 [Trapelia coarctata]|nr:hypothetical protein [Trapelia coarctata]
MSHTPPRSPMVAIVGATGTGKSQLAVTLAERFNGEIINADALQMYQGLPIATNKITDDERKGIPHHLLGCIGLEEEPWTVGKFVEEAGKIVEEMRGRGKLPVLVGGTHYYTQSLLYRNVNLKETEKDERISPEEQEKRWPILQKSGEEMLEKLRKVDPTMAAKWHPNDTRKIRRSLEIWLETGKTASELYAEQRTTKPTTTPTEALSIPESVTQGTHPPPRYDTLIFWLYDDPEILRERLNDRVDEMIKQGLLTEVETMERAHRDLESAGFKVDTTKGIWVAIGYKEFKEHLEALRSGASETQLERTEQTGIELTQIATRQYAKRQDRWIRLKLFQSFRDVQAADKFFLLDRSDASRPIEKTACDIAGAFLAGEPLPDPLSLSATAATILNSDKVVGADRATSYTRYCELCGTTVTTAKDWELHMKSKKHKYMLKPPREHNYPKRIPWENLTFMGEDKG